MCGIAGVVDFSGRPVEDALLHRMCQAIKHRGPDHQGTVRLGSTPERLSGAAAVGLGNRRLSIIDLETGNQPIANEDRTVWVVLNGEIYNFAELRRDLEARGHRFATHSDTEVIVHLYEERGERAVEALDGMFALAVWDERQQQLGLARDRFGKKPLVYADDGTRLRFASELQGLLVDREVDRTIDRTALADYLTYMAIPAPRTIYRAVRKLPPAHVMVRRAGETRILPYWSLSFEPKARLTEAAAVEQARALLLEAVRKRLISEVPLGAFLSGGVDSSGVVALMARLLDRPVKTFSIGFDEGAFNELPHAKRVAERYGCDHHEFVVQPKAVEVLPLLVRHFGEPYADSSAIPTYYLSKLTREHVTVALNGDGGDEAFAGYGRHLGYRLAERLQRVPGGIRRIPVGGRVRRPRSVRRSSQDRSVRAFPPVGGAQPRRPI
jgi:asparagine synthase (glutamine-hydrolysing)